MNDWLKDLEETTPIAVVPGSKEPGTGKNAPYVIADPIDISTSNIMYDLSKKRLEPKLDIDFSRIANLSSFQRFIIEVMKQQFPTAFRSVDPRASKKETAREFNKRKQYMKDCMTEFKGLLEKKGVE